MKAIIPLAFALVLALVFARPVGAQTTKPSAAPTAADALKALADGALPAFANAVEKTIRLELARKPLNEPAIIRLATLRALAQRMTGITPAAEKAKTLEWLVKHPTLGPLLLTALSERNNPLRVLAVLAALRQEFGKTLEEYPDLTVATCVVWDKPSREGQTPEQAAQAAREVFAHLTQNRATMRFDPRNLPWPVLVYLVDSHVSAEERRWALSTYKLPRRPGDAYFDVHYDYEGLKSGQWRGDEPYTLPNILKLGGVCKDEAYFATEVCRANGIPATVCTGQSSQGEGFHAWVGLLTIADKRVVFDFQTARYPEHGFWSGTVIDPQTGQKLTDREVAMLAEWCAAAPDKRLFSLALTRCLDLADKSQRVPLCKAALESAPANQEAWMILAGECAKPDAPQAIVQEVAGVVEKFAVGRYDDFAFKVFTMLITARKPEEQLTILDRAAALFPHRPDLQAETVLLKADALRQAARPVEALRMYEQLLEKALPYGPLVLEAMTRLDEMLRPAGKLRELTEHYRVVWTNMKLPEESGYAWTTPWYIVGSHYADLLDQTGDAATAAKVRNAVRQRDQSHHDQSAGK